MMGSIVIFAKKATFLAIAWVIGLIFVLIFSEIVLRIIYYDSTGTRKIPSKIASELSLPVGINYEYDISFHYKADEKSIKFTRDEYGIRNACGTPHNIDILTVGGSTTEQKYVKNESTFQAVIEDLILENMSKDVCVANAGIGGHSTYGHIRSFENWFPLLPKLSPKYVLLYVGINDAYLDRDYGLIKGKNRKLVKEFVRTFYLTQKSRPFFQYIRGERERIEKSEEIAKDSNYTATELTAGVAEKTEKHIIAFRTRFEKLLQYIEEMGAEPICVTQPHIHAKTIDGRRVGLSYGNYNGLSYDYPLQQVNKVMYELCGVDNIIDLYSAELPKGTFYDLVHTTDKGSELLGKKMFEAMKEKGMLEVF